MTISTVKIFFFFKGLCQDLYMQTYFLKETCFIVIRFLFLKALRVLTDAASHGNSGEHECSSCSPPLPEGTAAMGTTQGGSACSGTECISIHHTTVPTAQTEGCAFGTAPLWDCPRAPSRTSESGASTRLSRMVFVPCTVHMQLVWGPTRDLPCPPIHLVPCASGFIHSPKRAPRHLQGFARLSRNATLPIFLTGQSLPAKISSFHYVAETVFEANFT